MTPNTWITSTLYSFNSIQQAWLKNNNTEANVIKDFLAGIQTDASINEFDFYQDMISDAKIAMNIFIDGKQESQIDNTIFNKDVVPFLPLPSIIPTASFMASYNRAIAVNSAILKLQHPDWSQFHIYLMATANTWQLGLDAIGVFPVVGTVANLTSGTIYAINGDNVNATLSVVAAIPVAGWVAKGASVAVKDGNLMVKISNGIIKFTRDQSLFRALLGLVKGDGFIAHHVIPFALQEHALVQKAAEAGFHINEASNGIKLTNAVHSGSHQAYNTLVAQALDKIVTKAGGISNITPEIAKTALADLINKIELAIKNNPNVKINEITF